MIQNELYHYGIKRRSGRYPWGSGDRPFQSTSGKERRQLEKKGIRSKSYERDRIIPKGTKVYQTVNQDGTAYGLNVINYLDIDRDRSRGRKTLSREDEETKIYEREMILTEDLKVPGRQYLAESVNELVKKNPDLLNDAILKDAEKWAHRSVNELSKEEQSDFYKGLERQINKISNRSLDEAFIDLALTFDQENELKKELVKKLQNDGYNAMADEPHVKWKYVEGGDPLILFEPNKVTKTISEKEVTQKEAKSSGSRYGTWLTKNRTRYLKGS